MEKSSGDSQEVECRHCSSPSFWVDCLRRFQRWQNQPFTTVSTSDVTNFEDVVNVLHSKMLEIQKNGRKVHRNVEGTNATWSTWKDIGQNYCKKLLTDYQKSRFSLAELKVRTNNHEKMCENNKKYKNQKSEVKKNWAESLKKKWKKREDDLKEKFVKDREKKWAEKIKNFNFQYDQQCINGMKTIWDETQEGNWKGVQLYWRQKWDEEMERRWKDEKKHFRKQIEDELVEWDMERELDELTREEKHKLAQWQEQLREIYQQTEPTDLSDALALIEKMETGVEKWSEVMKRLSPSALFSLTTMATKTEEMLQMRENDVKRVSNQKLEEKTEELKRDYDRMLQESLSHKLEEMRYQFQYEIHKKETEIEEEKSQRYEQLLAQMLGFQQQKFDAKLELKNREIEEYQTSIEGLLQSIADIEHKHAKLETKFQIQTDHVSQLGVVIEDLVKNHEQELTKTDASWKQKMEQQNQRHEHDLTAAEVRIASKISDEYKTKDMYHYRLFETYKKRLEEKKEQINHLLSDMRRESKRSENRIEEARDLMEMALPRLMSILKDLSRVQEEKLEVSRKLEEEKRKLSDRSEEELKSLEEEVEKVREKYQKLENQFHNQLKGCYALESQINKISKSLDDQPFKQKMVKMAETPWQRDQLRLQNGEQTENQQMADTDLENVINSFKKLFEIN